ncbi:hypothetical protein E2C01_012763 [Portunus trituberculatus]|uniref:Uncharacterized protein n=1 Tax=Portunus trituberculatus TaxID=210409 RepID=A0A5B7DEY7_PORTR|nr:hypothetical protein [Portunus trituberculatus]
MEMIEREKEEEEEEEKGIGSQFSVLRVQTGQVRTAPGLRRALNSHFITSVGVRKLTNHGMYKISHFAAAAPHRPGLYLSPKQYLLIFQSRFSGITP